ncbi:hypothetical protein [Bradyrhizobium prioriisuperbiae]|uniref:hypothetical protein n=1 Tax=Bradyrhizobium prioriisuperbiae TaxID=2854389 RepID=UPI0028E6573B|nr:hypothetical protein [Bradyrhizobium prioritasuperba]
MKDGFTRDLLAALLRKPDYAAPTKPSTWRVMSAAGLERETSHATCDDACECVAPSRLKYKTKGE